MRNKKRKFTAEFKTQVVLEALSERMTLTELAQKYEVHPNLITNWKRDFVSHAHQAFEQKNGANPDLNKEKQKLYEKIGQLQMEIDFLKKVSERLNR